MASYVRSTMRSAVQEQNPYAARQAPGRRGWEVSRLPGPVLDRATAITAMLVAGTAGERDLPAGHLTSSVPCSSRPNVTSADEAGQGHADQVMAAASQSPRELRAPRVSPASRLMFSGAARRRGGWRR